MSHRFFSYLISFMLISVNSVAAQAPQQAPRFEGSKNQASSTGATAVRPQSPETVDPQMSVPGVTPQALVGAAALEAAREEGRIFTNEKNGQNASGCRNDKC